MRRKSGPGKEPLEKVNKDIRRVSRQRFSAEEKYALFWKAYGVKRALLPCAAGKA